MYMQECIQGWDEGAEQATDCVIEHNILKEYIGTNENVIIPDGVQIIKLFALSGSTIKSLTIPASVSHIVNSVFEYCYSLTELTILGKTVETSWQTFVGCQNLKTLAAPGVSWEVLKEARLLLPAAMGYLRNPEKYTEPNAAAYQKYIVAQRRKVLPRVISEDIVCGLEIYAQLGKITAKNVDEEYMQPAIGANATQCIAFLLDWKGKNISAEEYEKQIQRELEKDPYNAADMKKKWSWDTLADDTLAITDYKGNEKDVCVPLRVGDKSVTVIGVGAFSTTKSRRLKTVAAALRKISAITLPEEIHTISDEAFSGCESLSFVSVPGKVKRIGSKAFCGCKSLTNIVIPSGVTKIEEWTFTNCEQLCRILLPKGITEIGTGAFSDCVNMTSITIPEGVTSLGGWCFYRCSRLMNVSIPGSVTYIGAVVFSECPKLTIHAPAGSYAETYAKENNIPFVAE